MDTKNRTFVTAQYEYSAVDEEFYDLFSSHSVLERGGASHGEVDCIGLPLLVGALGLSLKGVESSLASHLEKHQGSLRSAVNGLLCNCDRVYGVGPANLRRLNWTLALSNRIAFEELNHSEVVSPDMCEKYLQRHFALQRREIFCCLFLNSRNRLLACRNLFAGTLDGAAVYPREVAAEALRLQAKGVIAAHNHPSGHTSPSQADRRITERLRDALAVLDIRLLDHVIVGHGRVHSMASHGDVVFGV